MRRITRYVITEFLRDFLVALTLITAVMILVVIAAEAIREGLAPETVFKLLPYVVPMALLYAIPGTTLFAVCSVYGRMSAANEIVAIKAAGISPLSVLSPILVVTFVMSVLVVWVNDVAVSWGRTGFKRVVLESVEQIAYGMLRTQKAYTTDRFSISVRAVEGQRLIKPTVTFRVNDTGPAMTFTADEADLHSHAANETLRIVLRNYQFDHGEVHAEDPDEFTHEIPLEAATRRGYESNRPADTALSRIPQEKVEQRRQIEELQRVLAADAAMQMMLGDFDTLTSSDWIERHQQVRNMQMRLHRLETEPWRRVANGFSCLCFALVGSALAIRLRNADVWSSFWICFLPILLVYYPLMMYGVGLAKSGEMPPHVVWLGNLVLAAIGYWQVRKVLRY
jgi:lipopolysaccharide export system permease protein